MDTVKWTDVVTALATSVIAVGTPGSLVFFALQFRQGEAERAAAWRVKERAEWQQRQPRMTITSAPDRGLHGTAIMGAVSLHLDRGDAIWEVTASVEVEPPWEATVSPDYFREMTTPWSSEWVEITLPIRSPYRPGDDLELSFQLPEVATLVIQYTDAVGDRCERRQALEVDPQTGLHARSPAVLTRLRDGLSSGWDTASSAVRHSPR
jgi:phosphotransferase system HPr-like phosphotransfer protein